MAAWGFAYFLPLDHPVYPSLDFLIHRNLLPELTGNAKPYDSYHALSALLKVDTSAISIVEKSYWKEAKGYLSVFESRGKDNRLLLEAYLHGYGDYKDSLLGMMRGIGGVAYTYGNFTIADRVSVDLTNEDNRYDHLDRQFKAKLPSDMPQAYLSYSGEHFGMLLGRNAMQWGPGKSGNLILGARQPSMNIVSAWAKIGFLKGYTLSSKLNSYDGMESNFSASRLVISINKDISLALNQSVIYSGDKRGFELYYLTPSFIYYFSQFGFTQYNETENTFVGADGEWRINKMVRTYFEFLADDFQVDRDATSRTTQNAIAWLIGVDCPEVYKKTGFAAEFVHINSYVYKHMGGWPTHYIANSHGGVLGHELGPDAEELNLWLTNRVSDHLSLGLAYNLKRLGDLNNIYGPWDGFGKADANIPHGRVENTHTVSVEGGLSGYKGLSATMTAGYSLIINKNNLNADDSNPWLRLQADYYFGRILQWKTRENLF